MLTHDPTLDTGGVSHSIQSPAGVSKGGSAPFGGGLGGTSSKTTVRVGGWELEPILSPVTYDQYLSPVPCVPQGVLTRWTWAAG